MEAVVASPRGDTVVGLLSPKQGWAQRGAGGHWQPWRHPVWWQFGTHLRELGRGVTQWLCCVAPLRLPWVATDEPEQPLVPQPCAVPCPGLPPFNSLGILCCEHPWLCEQGQDGSVTAV